MLKPSSEPSLKQSEKQSLKPYYELQGNLMKIAVAGNSFDIEYDKDSLKGLGKQNCEAILDNLVCLFTMPWALNNPLIYKNKPFFYQSIEKGVLNDIPRIAEEVDGDTKSLIDAFKSMKIRFGNDAKKISLKEQPDENSIMMGMSFGKDSLLSFGLAEELNLNNNLIFFNDTEELDANEYKHKILLIKDFTKKFKKNINIVRDNTDKIFTDQTKTVEEFTKTNAMLSYALEILPVAKKFNSKYIVFGNEHNFNDSFQNKDGYKAFTSYDQTSEYMEMINNQFDDFGGDFRVLSLIEPIYNIAEYKMLLRYPNLLKYVMSCSGSEKERWCYSCPMCAKTYIFSLAVGLKPAKMSFKVNFLDKKHEQEYPLFSKPKRAYERPPAVRDEQLFAFYLAFKNGAKGYLIDKFKEHHLNEAKEREEELRKKFFGIHEGKTIPKKIRPELISIFKEELDY
ncbi:MAG: hypothetical protein Q8O89_03865 [Nanoarchaeota archaeon]|nr:hypothetical protein [Nanoarchaeota archaeon]